MLRRRQVAVIANNVLEMADQNVRVVSRQLSEYPTWMIAAAVALWFLLYLIALMDERSIGIQTQTSLIEYKDSIDLSPFEECATRTITTPEQGGGELKTFWFSQYPDSVSEDIIRSIVQTVTGLSTGAKSYYAQNKNFRKCQGQGQTVACMQVHPMFGADPERFESRFNPEVIYSIRNPATAFPAHQNAKAIRYAHHEGQVSEDEWRRFRDQFAAGMMTEYKRQLSTWRHMSYYNVALYLPLEELMDPALGPGLVKQMAALFRSRGYTTVTDYDIPCIWYQSIGKEQLEAYHRFRYEFSGFTPGYTREQLHVLDDGLSELMNEERDEERLVNLLKQYRESVRHETRLDHAWVNQTQN